MRATALVAADPEFMAMPMSACLIASASFTPSPVIATVWPRPAARYDAPSSARGDATEHRCFVEHLAELGGVGRQRAGVEALGNIQPELARDRRDGVRVVAGDDPDVDALLGEVAERLRRVRSQPLAEGHQRDGLEHVRAGLVRPRAASVSALGGVGEHERRAVRIAASSRDVVRGASPLRGIGCGVREDHLGGAEHPRARRAREDDRAPLAADENGDACTLGQRRHGNGSRGIVAVAFASGAAPYQASTISPSGAAAASSGCAASNTMSPAVRVPVLSRQIDVDARQALDGRQLLHEHLAGRRA